MTAIVQLMVLVCAASAAVYARTSLSPLQERMSVALSLTDNQVALLQGPALALPLLIAAIPVGLMIDRSSRVRLLIVLSALMIAGTVLTALASTFTLLFVGRCMVGLATTAISTAAFSVVSDICAPAQRGRAVLLLAIGQFAGNASAFALGGTLLVHMEHRTNAWQTALLLMTLPLVLVLLMLLAMREPARREQAIVNPSARRAFAELWSYRGVALPLLAGLVLLEVAFQSALVWCAPMLSRRFSLTPDRVGAIMATALMVSGLVGPIAGGMLADFAQARHGPRFTLSVLSALALLTFPAAFFGGLPGGLTFASALITVFLTLTTAQLVIGTALFTVVVPNELRGLCMSLFASATLIFGVGMGPLGVSTLATAFGGAAFVGDALSAVGAAVCVLAAMSFLAATRRHSAALV